MWIIFFREPGYANWETSHCTSSSVVEDLIRDWCKAAQAASDSEYCYRLASLNAELPK